MTQNEDHPLELIGEARAVVEGHALPDLSGRPHLQEDLEDDPAAAEGQAPAASVLATRAVVVQVGRRSGQCERTTKVA